MKVAQHPNCRHLPVQMTEKNLLNVRTLAKFADEEREQMSFLFPDFTKPERGSLKKCRKKSILML